MHAAAAIKWDAICLTIAAILFLIQFLFRDEIKRGEKSFLLAFQRYLRGVSVPDLSARFAGTFKALYDHYLSPRYISWRVVSTVFVLVVANTLALFLTADNQSIGRIEHPGMWIFLACFCFVGTVIAIPSTVITRYYLNRAARMSRTRDIVPYLAVDGLFTYLLVALHVYLIAVFLIPMYEYFRGDSQMNWQFVRLMGGFEWRNALRWPIQSPIGMNNVGSDAYALVALAPALLWAWATAGAAIVFLIPEGLRLTLNRITNGFISSKVGALSVLGGAMTLIAGLIDAWRG